jgi:hypothetical protein
MPVWHRFWVGNKATRTEGKAAFLLDILYGLRQVTALSGEKAAFPDPYCSHGIQKVHP